MNLAGYVPIEKKEVTVGGLSSEDIDKQLAKLLGYDEELPSTISILKKKKNNID
jgi:hypothetical protein